MRIAQISTLAGLVHPEHGGSVEQLVWSLDRELTRLGHEVTVFGAAGSEPSGELVATLPGPYAQNGAPNDWELCEWINLCRAVEESRRFDVLHSHAYLWGLPVQRLSSAPMIHTMHVQATEDAARLRSLYPDACVTGISHYQWHAFPQLRPASVIYHGVDPSRTKFYPEPEDYVCFLGRFLAQKGVLAAIRTARGLGLPLLLAGPRDEYYHSHIEPLVDGHSVQYVGWVRGARRDQLLGGARALLYPIRSAEPFGLVMLEAMMRGTPVAAIGLGAVPEVLDEGVTGHSTPSLDEYPQTVLKTLELDRSRVRARAEARFSVQRMAREYLDVYERMLTHGRTPVVAVSSSR